MVTSKIYACCANSRCADSLYVKSLILILHVLTFLTLPMPVPIMLTFLTPIPIIPTLPMTISIISVPIIPIVIKWILITPITLRSICYFTAFSETVGTYATNNANESTRIIITINATGIDRKTVNSICPTRRNYLWHPSGHRYTVVSVTFLKFHACGLFCTLGA